MVALAGCIDLASAQAGVDSQIQGSQSQSVEDEDGIVYPGVEIEGTGTFSDLPEPAHIARFTLETRFSDNGPGPITFTQVDSTGIIEEGDWVGERSGSIPFELSPTFTDSDDIEPEQFQPDQPGDTRERVMEVRVQMELWPDVDPDGAEPTITATNDAVEVRYEVTWTANPQASIEVNRIEATIDQGDDEEND